MFLVGTSVLYGFFTRNMIVERFFTFVNLLRSSFSSIFIKMVVDITVMVLSTVKSRRDKEDAIVHYCGFCGTAFFKI